MKSYGNWVASNGIMFIHCRVVKLSMCLTNQALCHEGIWGSGCIDPHILDPGTSWRWVVSFTLWLLYPVGKEPPAPTGKEAGWGLEPVWLRWRREKSGPYWDSISDPSVVQPVASRYTNCNIPALDDRTLFSENWSISSKAEMWTHTHTHSMVIL
jgi:hypothetical protein